MNYRELLVESGKKMYSSGLTVGTWGNISARDPETGLIYLTPSGMAYNTITPDDIVVMNSKAELVEGHRTPTVEKLLHIGVYNKRDDVNAVIHTHPIYSQVFACLNEDIPPVIDESAQILGGTVKCAKYALPGTADLANEVVKALGDGFACLLANHGALCVGSNMDAAFLVCTVLEMTAQIDYMARCIGEPKVISDDKVKAMRDFLLHVYGQRK